MPRPARAYGQLEWRPATHGVWVPGCAPSSAGRATVTPTAARLSRSTGCRWTPRGGVSTFDAGRSAYLTLSRGYKAGGFNIGALVPDDRRLFGPEYLRSIELGLRLQGAPTGASRSMRHCSTCDAATSRSAPPRSSIPAIRCRSSTSPTMPRAARIAARSWRRRGGHRCTGVRRHARVAAQPLSSITGSAARLDGRDAGARAALAVLDEPRVPRARGWMVRACRPAGWSTHSISPRATTSARALPAAEPARGLAAHVRWEASIWVRNAFDAGWTQRGFFFGNEPPDFPEKLYVQPGDPRQAGITITCDLR